MTENPLNNPATCAHYCAGCHTDAAQRMEMADKAAVAAALAPIEALADEFEEISRTPRKWMAYPSAARMLRAALAEGGDQ